MQQKPHWARRDWLRRHIWTIVILVLAAGLFAGLYAYAHGGAEAEPPQAAEYAEYENAVVREILSDSCQQDPTADGGYRGSQSLLVEVKTGRYQGETLLTTNTVGPLYGEPVSAGDGVTLLISTYEDGSHTATVYEYNRSTAVYWLSLIHI